MSDNNKFMIKSYAGSLFEDMRNDGLLMGSTSDVVEMLDRIFFDDFMNHTVNLDWTDEETRSTFRAEVESLYSHLIQK